MKYSQSNNTIHVFITEKLSACSNNLCFHTKATNSITITITCTKCANVITIIITSEIFILLLLLLKTLNSM